VIRQPCFASRVFRWAGVYGLLVLAPLYFMAEKIARGVPSLLTHPDHFYGFLGVALAWQFGFLLIAGDVRRYRPFMIPAIAEKVLPSAATLLLYATGRVTALAAAPAVVDLVLAMLFAIAFLRCRESGHPE
jgi:hypothetical protein